LRLSCCGVMAHTVRGEIRHLLQLWPMVTGSCLLCSSGIVSCDISTDAVSPLRVSRKPIVKQDPHQADDAEALDIFLPQADARTEDDRAIERFLALPTFEQSLLMGEADAYAVENEDVHRAIYVVPMTQLLRSAFALEPHVPRVDRLANKKAFKEVVDVAMASVLLNNKEEDVGQSHTFGAAADELRAQAMLPENEDEDCANLYARAVMAHDRWTALKHAEALGAHRRVCTNTGHFAMANKANMLTHFSLKDAWTTTTSAAYTCVIHAHRSVASDASTVECL
jgi:hypothetical protein